MTTKFRVWAPLPKKVELLLGKTRLPMRAESGGWWTTEAGRIDPPGQYGFILDGKGPYPDPRSLSQPRGIDGPSQLVDHAQFSWADADWQPPDLSDAIIYELHIGTFTPQGTFDSAIEKLPYLMELGVTHVEIMPVNEFSGSRGWGYDGVDLYAPHHAYGGPDGLKRLVNACHINGLAAILDVVYNHIGPAGNYLPKFGPYFSTRHRSPWGSGMNFDDAECGEVRRFFCDNALMWLRDYHFDALRLDAVHAIFDGSAVPFLEQLSAEVKKLQSDIQRPLALIAESDLNDPRLLRSPDSGGFGLRAQWSDDFHHALHALLTGERSGYYADFGAMADLAKALRDVFVYDGRFSKFRRRPHGRPPTGLDGAHFLAYLQNHDQIGNRAAGERSSRLMSPGRLKIAAALIFTSPFIPMLFQGEEWAAGTPFLYFTDHQEPKLAEAVRRGRREEFAGHGWDESKIPDPQAPETFERSKLNWSELNEPFHAEMLDWHKRLIALRRAEPELRDGRREQLKIRHDESGAWLAIERGPFAILFNIGKEPNTIELPAANRKPILSSSPDIRLEKETVILPSDSVAVLK